MLDLGQGIQDWTKKNIGGQQPLKDLNWYGLPKQAYLPQIVPGPFLNNLTQLV